MPEITKPSLKKVSLPVVQGNLLGAAPPPVFGSAEVSRYGAVGLEVAVPEQPAHAGGSGPGGSRSADGKRRVYQISRVEPLALVDNITHHQVDADHLWLGVNDGVLVVLDDDEHDLMQVFVAGASPEAVARYAEAALDLDPENAWKVTAALIGRLSAAGFVRGILGYHSVLNVRPDVFARFHLTNRCQLECIHCYTGSSPHLPDDNELSTERWLQLVDDFADNGGEKLLLTGGEALVHRGCIDIMRRAKARKLEVTLFSNGILVPRHIDAIKECVDVVQISIDGATAESHDHVRGEGSFKKAMRAIRALLDAGIKTRVSTTLMTDNWKVFKAEFPSFMAQFEGTDLGFRISYGAMSHGRGEQLDQSLDIRETRPYVDQLMARFNPSEDRAHGRNATQKLTGCGYAEQLVVAADGIVYPCHLLSGGLGHIDQLPVPQIMRYLERTAEAFSVSHRKGCGTCDLRHLCGGSCRVADEKLTGSRLITTCTPEEKLRKKRFLIQRYRPLAESDPESP